MKLLNEEDYFGKFKICQVCGKDIKKQKVMMCSKCKVAIKVEYQSLKKEYAKKVYKVLS